MKLKFSLFVAFFAILTFTSCEDEPLTGTFVDETGVGATSQNQNLFSAKVDNANFSEDAITVTSLSLGGIDYLNIVGAKTSGEQIVVNIPLALNTGDYTFVDPLTATNVSGVYIANGVSNNATSGALTITAKTANSISGTFNFTAGTGTTYQVTEGSFSVNY